MLRLWHPVDNTVYFRVQLLKKKINSTVSEPLNLFIMALFTQRNGTVETFYMRLKSLQGWFQKSTRFDDLFMIKASLQF